MSTYTVKQGEESLNFVINEWLNFQKGWLNSTSSKEEQAMQILISIRYLKNHLEKIQLNLDGSYYTPTDEYRASRKALVDRTEKFLREIDKI